MPHGIGGGIIRIGIIIVFLVRSVAVERCVFASYLIQRRTAPKQQRSAYERRSAWNAMAGASARGTRVRKCRPAMIDTHTHAYASPVIIAHIRTYSERACMFWLYRFFKTKKFFTFLIGFQTIAKVNKIGYFFKSVLTVIVVIWAAVPSIFAPNASSKRKLGERKKRGKNAIFPLSHQVRVRVRISRVLYGRVVMRYCDADQRARPAPSTLLHTCWSSLHVQCRPNKEHSRACAKGAPYIIPTSWCHHHHLYTYTILLGATMYNIVSKTTSCSIPSFGISTDQRDAMMIIIIIIIKKRGSEDDRGLHLHTAHKGNALPTRNFTDDMTARVANFIALQRQGRIRVFCYCIDRFHRQ